MIPKGCETVTERLFFLILSLTRVGKGEDGGAV